jgi:hypothetical protein
MTGDEKTDESDNEVRSRSCPGSASTFRPHSCSVKRTTWQRSFADLESICRRSASNWRRPSGALHYVG